MRVDWPPQRAYSFGGRRLHAWCFECDDGEPAEARDDKIELIAMESN